MSIFTLLQLNLFGDPVGVVTPPTIPAKRRRVAAAVSGWDLTDHACKHCLGRVLQRVHADGAVEVRCAECGAHADGGIREVCCCGAECGTLGHVLECFRNPNVSQEVPQEVLVRERLVEDRRGDRRQARHVKGPEF